MAGRIRAAAVVICLVASSCSVAFGDETESALLDAADEAAVAVSAAASVSAAAWAALGDAEARATSAQIKQDEKRSAFEANLSSQAFAEWSAAVVEMQAAVADGIRLELAAGEANLASWEAQLVWVTALLAVEEHRSGGSNPSIEETYMGILADLAREMISLVEERNEATSALGAAQTKVLQVTAQLNAAGWAGDNEAVESLTAEARRVAAALNKAAGHFDNADAAVRQAQVRWAAAVEQATRYGDGG